MQTNIGLEIIKDKICIVGLEDDILVIAIKIYQNENTNIILNPYLIYKILEDNNKNTYENKKIIEKIIKEDEDIIEYHFNYGLTLNSIQDNIAPIPIFFSYDIIGNKTAIPQNALQELTDKYGYERQDYKSIFEKEVYINCSCFERLKFSNCEFKSKISLHIFENKYRKTEFHNGINFENCIFNGEVEFKNLVSGTPLPNNKYYNNGRETNFKNCIFEKDVDFSNAKFFNEVHFDNSHFKKYANFQKCEFEKTACFYGVTFDKVLNFSQANFKGNLNIVNANLNFDFDDLKEKIKQEYQHSKNNKKHKDNKDLDKVTNDFRDSFRIFKNVLIKDNNILDASSFHKYELYCKEIELEEIWHKQMKKEK